MMKKTRTKIDKPILPLLLSGGFVLREVFIWRGPFTLTRVGNKWNIKNSLGRVESKWQSHAEAVVEMRLLNLAHHNCDLSTQILFKVRT